MKSYANSVLPRLWRLRREKQEPGHFDLASYAQQVDWAEFDLAPYVLHDGDIVVGDIPYTELSAGARKDLFTFTYERFFALRWLQEGGFYSKTDVSFDC